MLSKIQKKKILKALSEEGEYRKLLTSEEIHHFAMRWNWDDGVEPLDWVVDQKKCDLGTALLIYWFAAPQWFNKFSNREDVQENNKYNLKNYDLIMKIENKVLNNFYILKDFYFDPTNYDGQNLTEPSFSENSKRKIPAEMFCKNDGILIERENLIEKSFTDITPVIQKQIMQNISKGYQFLQGKGLPLFPDDKPLDIIRGIQQFVNLFNIEPTSFPKNDESINNIGWVFLEQVRREYKWDWKLCFYNEKKQINLLSSDTQYVINPNAILNRYFEKNILLKFFKTIGKAKKTQDFSEFYAVGMIFLETDWT